MPLPRGTWVPVRPDSDLSTIPTRAPQEHVTAPEEADGSATRLRSVEEKATEAIFPCATGC